MKIAIIWLLIIIPFPIFGQISDPLEADRPDQTETPSIVPKGRFQAEMGFTFQKSDALLNSWALPSVLWKYGVTKNFELRLITEFVLEEIDGKETAGFVPLLIGGKIKICSEKGLRPKSSFIGHLSIPEAASTKYKAVFYAPEFRFTMQHTLSDKITLGYNLGCEWDGFSDEPTFIYTLTMGYSLSEKVGVYVELFGYAPQNGFPKHNFDGGFTYWITPDFMVDLSFGLGLTHNAPNHYLALGISFRI